MLGNCGNVPAESTAVPTESATEPSAEPVIENIPTPTAGSYIEKDYTTMEKYNERFSSLTLTKGYKSSKNHNPLITQRYGADPGVFVDEDGTFYVYMSNDTIGYDAEGNIAKNVCGDIKGIGIVSSKDLVNWTDHGVVYMKDVSKWAVNSWAPTATYKYINGKKKYFIYFANNASSIGVLTSDSPVGPWKDPIGKAIITRNTPNCSDVTWMFDPAVLVDDDNTAYLYFGGGIPDENYEHTKTARVIQLGDDMITTVGSAAVIDAPFLFEDSGITKINGKYYYSYCLNWNDDANATNPGKANIGYMVSDNPMGPFTYVGLFLRIPVIFSEYTETIIIH